MATLSLQQQHDLDLAFDRILRGPGGLVPNALGGFSIAAAISAFGDAVAPYPGTGQVFITAINDGTNSPSFVLNTQNNITTGSLLGVQNQGVPMLTLDYQGNLTIPGHLISDGGFNTVEVINVKDHGALGDDSTDDTAAINAAIALAAPGATVYFPPATYKITSFLNVTTSNLLFEGYGAKIKQYGAAQQGFLVNAATGVIFEGLWLYNALPNGGWTGSPVNINGIRLFSGADDAKIINCRIENWGESAIRIDSSARLEVSGCKLIGVGSAGGLVPGSTENFGIYGAAGGPASSGFKFLNNEIYNSAFGIFLCQDTDDYLLDGNQIHNIPGQHGVYIDGGKGGRIVNNNCRTMPGSGIKVQITSSNTEDCTGLVIANNVTDATGGDGILVIPALTGLTNRFKSPIVSNNTVRNAGQDGILIDQADNWIVSNNTVDTAGTVGIRIGTGSPAGFTAGHGKLSGNTIANTQHEGISGRITDTFHNVLVENNILTDVALAGSGFSAINLDVGFWNLRHNTINNSSAPTYDYHLNIASGAKYLLEGLYPSASLTLKTVNALGTLGTNNGARAVIDLADFGAQGDGSFDHTFIFAAALAALPNGGKIKVPTGIYKTNTLIAQGNITLEGTSAKLFGSDTQNTQLSPQNPALPVIQIGNGIANVEYCNISKFYFVGDNSNATGDGISINGASYVQCDDVNLNGFGRHNVTITSSATQGSAFIRFNHINSINFGKSGTGAGINIDYGSSATEYIFITDFIFNDGGFGGSPTAPAIQMNAGTFADFTNGFISGSGASVGDPFGRSGGIHISGSPFNGPTLNLVNVHIDSPAGGSVDELIVIDSTQTPITDWIVGKWTCDGWAIFTTDNSIVAFQGSEFTSAASFLGPIKETTTDSTFTSGQGVYQVGWRLWNRQPVPGGFMGWVVTTAGAYATAGAWTASTPYTRGDGNNPPQSVTNGGNVYQCIISGNSGNAGGPTGTGLNITDPGGTAHWRYMGPNGAVFKEFGPISF